MLQDAVSGPQGRCDKATEECMDLMYHLPTSATGNLHVSFRESLILSWVASKWTCWNDTVDVTPREWNALPYSTAAYDSPSER